MSNWLYANDEPTAIWRGAQSIPRTLTLRAAPDGLRLVQAPVAELERLRATPRRRRSITGAARCPRRPRLSWTVKRGELDGSRHPSVERRRRGGDRRRHRASRSSCSSIDAGRGATPFHAAYAGRHAGPLAWRDGRLTLRVLFDRSVIEVFAGDGETVITDRVFPTQPFDRLELLPSGGAQPAARMWTLGVGLEPPPIARHFAIDCALVFSFVGCLSRHPAPGRRRRRCDSTGAFRR